MNIDRDTFFAFARNAPFGGRLTQQQVDGTNALLDAWDKDGHDDDRQLAYLLATVFHETGGRMVPVREAFATSDADAIRRLDAAYAAGQLPMVSKPYWRDGWFGRGPVQITFEDNYRKMGKALGVDLEGNPSLLLDPVVGARSAVVGMVKGLFVRGQNLSRYFNDTVDDPVGARRIINGTSRASLIAGYHVNFLDSIKAARVEAAKPTPVPAAVVEAAKPDGASLVKDKTSIGGALSAVGGIGGVAAAAPLLSAINSPWAFAALALLVVIIAIGSYLTLTGRLNIRKVSGA